MKIAINGFGRIGRIFFRQVYPDLNGRTFERPDFEIVAVNDLGDVENLVYLLKYDSVYGKYKENVEAKNGSIFAGNKEIKVFSEKDPAALPWKDLNIDVVVESTGVFTTFEKAELHIKAGAKRVVITAPAKDDTVTATPNAGIEFLCDMLVSSNASCTTNAIIPVIKIMFKNPGISKAMLNTVHGYTATQGLVDQPDAKDFRRGRAGAQNIVPSSTGAAEAVFKVIPEMKGIFDGIAMRVPVISGSLIDFTFLAKRKTTVDEINGILIEASNSPEWQGIFKATNEPFVSSDILGEPYGSIADLAFTRVVDGDLVKILSWYDNEYGYCAMLIKHIEELKKLL